MTSLINALHDEILEHNDRIREERKVIPETAADFIWAEEFNGWLSIRASSKKTTDYVYYTIWVIEKDGVLTIETWVVNRSNNFGFYLDDVEVSKDKFIETAIEHFKNLECASVEAAYAAIYELERE